MVPEVANLTTPPVLLPSCIFRCKSGSRSSELSSPSDQRTHYAMKREQALIDTLLDEIESMPIGNGGSVPDQYFFFKLNNISSERNPREFARIKSALTAVRQHEELKYPQGVITYHLRLLLEGGFISGELIETYDGTSIAVKGLTAQGHAYLDDRRMKVEGPLSKALKALQDNAPEWVARYLVTSSVKWVLGIAGLFAASQIPVVKQFLLSVWFGQYQ